VESLIDERERPAICRAHYSIHSKAVCSSSRREIHAVPHSSIPTFLGVGIWQDGDALSSVDSFWVNFVDAP
jgi:hypothetical protein